jgi:hypothetical protein
MDYELQKRRKHLAPYADAYKRVFDILFAMLDKCSDLDACVFKVQYYPRPRVMQVGLGWQKSDTYPRSTGFIALWHGGIFNTRGDIETWPKLKCNVDNWRSIGVQSDDEIIERILTCSGAPWADRFAVPEEAGALRYDALRLLRTISGMQAIVSPTHQFAVNDLMRRIELFAQEVGV